MGVLHCDAVGAGSALLALLVLAAGAALTAVTASTGLGPELEAEGAWALSVFEVLARASRYAVSPKPDKVAKTPATSVP